ncbi:MAG: helix-turn-helix domain-containing protein [Planctomycetota bacterium]|jgi:hypothetical protein
MAQQNTKFGSNNGWPKPPPDFPLLMTPTEAAQFLRLDQTSLTPESAKRTLNYWRDRGELRATKYARRVWYLREELERFLRNKTEE